MEEFNRKVDSWIRNHLIPQLTKGDTNVQFTREQPSGNYFLSDTFFMTLRSPKNGEKRMLVKLPSHDAEVLSKVDYDTIFTNEIKFYKEFLPGNKYYPQCYFAGKDPVFKSVIILEDVRPQGYIVSPNKVNVHLDYVIAGLRAIARFHAQSFALKEKEPEKFHSILKTLHDSRFRENPHNQIFGDIINERVARAIEIIRARKDNSELTKRLCDVFDDAFVNVMLKCVKAKEPLATIIHGDCTINNLLYRWEKKDSDDLQLQSMLIDFGLLMHSSPCLDISTLIYMTCTREDIRDRSKDLFEGYHSSLMEFMKESGIWNASKYSLESMWRDYRSRAVFGYIIAAFFRGMMTDFDREHDTVELKSMAEWGKKNGGQEVTVLLVNMLEDLRDGGFLEDFIGK